VLIIFILASGNIFARESEGMRDNSLLLNGAWEYAIGNGNERET